MKILVEHTFDIPRDVFVEQVFFDDAFNEAVHAHMNFRARNVLERSEDDVQRCLTIEYITGEKLPWVARKLFGHDDVGWVEELRFDKAKWQAHITMRPHILADRFSSQGIMSFEALPDGRTHRTFAIDVTVSIPGVGKAIEKKMVADTEKNFATMVAFTEQWIADKGLR